MATKIPLEQLPGLIIFRNLVLKYVCDVRKALHQLALSYWRFKALLLSRKAFIKEDKKGQHIPCRTSPIRSCTEPLIRICKERIPFSIKIIGGEKL